MKRICAYILSAVLLASAALSTVSCTSPGGGIETYPKESGNTNPPVADTGSADSSTVTDGNAEAPASHAPDFTALDREGNEVKLSDFFGKPIVLNFWASWCPPCKAELPDFETVFKKYEGKVTFLMVNLTDGQRETVEIAKSFVESQGYTFPVYFDTKYEASYNYGVSSIPQTYFIDAEGNLVAYATGMITGSQLEEGIGMIYSE